MKLLLYTIFIFLIYFNQVRAATQQPPWTDDASLLSWKDKLVLFGGAQWSKDVSKRTPATNAVWIYDTSAKSWSLIKAEKGTPTPPIVPKMVGYINQDTLYAFATGFNGTVWGFDLNGKKWTKVAGAANKVSISQSSMYTAGNKVFFLGGRSRASNKYLDFLTVFDINKKKWTRAGYFPLKIENAAVVVLDDGNVLTVGGRGFPTSGEQNPVVNTREEVFYGNINNNQFKKLEYASGSVKPEPRASACLGRNSKGTLLMFGGRKAALKYGAATSFHEVYEVIINDSSTVVFKNQTDSLINTVSAIRWKAASCVILNDIMYVTGLPESTDASKTAASTLFAMNMNTFEWTDPTGLSLKNEKNHTTKIVAQDQQTASNQVNTGAIVGSVTGGITLIILLVVAGFLVRIKTNERNQAKGKYSDRRQSLMHSAYYDRMNSVFITGFGVAAANTGLDLAGGDRKSAGCGTSVLEAAAIRGTSELHSPVSKESFTEIVNPSMITVNNNGRIYQNGRYRVRYDYLPARDDEVELLRGDVILVETIFLDDWGVVLHEASGKRGVCPLQCLGPAVNSY